MSGSAHRMLKIAQVLKSNGTDGELVIGFTSVMPEDIDIKEPVFIMFDELPVPFYFRSFTKRGSRKALARITGVNSLKDAEEIAGRTLYADESSLELEYDEGDFSFLEGWILKDSDGNTAGTITEFEDIPGNPCIHVACPSGEEVMVPLHDDLIESADSENMTLTMNIPEGLF